LISCLNNYIGVLNVTGYTNPDSGYFINDLAGISTNQLEEISDTEDQYEPRLAFDDIYARASRLLESDIKTGLKKYFKNYSYISNTITGYYKENESISQGANYNGWYFDLGAQSKNLNLNLTSFDLYLASDSVFTIVVYDLATGSKLDEIDFSGTAGLQTYRVDKNYPLHRYTRIFIGYDESEVSTFKTSDFVLNDTLSLRRGNIPKSGSIIYDNFNSTDSGMILTYNLECSVDQFVCQRLPIFKDAFLYKLGVEFCTERIYSDRINRYTLMDRDRAIELRTEYEIQYKELIDNAITDLKVDSDGICFECNRLVSYKTILG